MKKVFVFLFFLMFIIGGGCQKNIQSANSSEETIAPVTKSNPTPPRIGTPATPKPSVTPRPAPTPTQILSTPDPTPSPGVAIQDYVLECALVGYWHAAPGVPAGYAERYIFLIDHTFIWVSSQMDTTNRVIDIEGTWIIKDGVLLLTATSKWILVGGEIVADVINGEELVGATSDTIDIDPPEITIIPDFTIIKDDEINLRHQYAIEIDGIRYWKFNAFDDISSLQQGYHIYD